MFHFIYAVEVPKNNESEFLFSKDFLKSMRFLSSSYVGENNSSAFMQKYLNIMDPIRENNNLGRCITQGFDYPSFFNYEKSNKRCL